MANLNIKTATPLSSTGLAGVDRFPVGDVSEDGWVCIEADDLLDALLRIAASNGVVSLDATSEFFVVRKRGGTVGTHEVQIKHAGAGGSGSIASMSGSLVFSCPLSQSISVSDNNGGSNAVFAFNMPVRLNWGLGVLLSADNSTYDVGYARAAASVLAITNGSSGGGTISSVPLSPAQLTTSVNNYTPGTARTLRLSSDAARSVTGLVAGVDGQELRIFNVGSQTITLEHQDVGSTAANRFLCTSAADIVLAADEGAGLMYDSTSTRWRVWKL